MAIEQPDAPAVVEPHRDQAIAHAEETGHTGGARPPAEAAAALPLHRVWLERREPEVAIVMHEADCPDKEDADFEYEDGHMQCVGCGAVEPSEG